MTETREQVERSRQQLANCKQRGERLITNAESYRDWPHNCDARTLLFGIELAINAIDLVDRGAQALGMSSDSLDEPLTDAILAELTADSADDRGLGLAPGDRLEVRFALAERMASMATALLQSAENTLEGKEDLSGQTIRRSPLYDK